MKVEILFAKALLGCEPEKKPEGSVERRSWLKLMLIIYEYLILHDLNHGLFQAVLLEDQTDDF